MNTGYTVEAQGGWAVEADGELTGEMDTRVVWPCPVLKLVQMLSGIKHREVALD